MVQLMQENLKKLNIDKQWLERQLQLLGVDSLPDVFYVEVQKDGTFYIDFKNDVLH